MDLTKAAAAPAKPHGANGLERPAQFLATNPMRPSSTAASSGTGSASGASSVASGGSQRTQRPRAISAVALAAAIELDGFSASDDSDDGASGGGAAAARAPPGSKSTHVSAAGRTGRKPSKFIQSGPAGTGGSHQTPRYQQQQRGGSAALAAMGDAQTADGAFDEGDSGDESEHASACRACGSEGHVLCCDTCSNVFHQQCARPPLPSVPAGRWSCSQVLRVAWLGVVLRVVETAHFESGRISQGSESPVFAIALAMSNRNASIQNQPQSCDRLY
jgi:hypothetical protein